MCFGKEWNDDGNNNCLMYEGGYCNDKRWGKGISYDLDGNVDYEGEWMNNHGMSENGKIVKDDLIISKSFGEFVIDNEVFHDDNEKILINELIVPMSIEELVIGDKMCNDNNITSFHFSPLLVQLKRVEIGNKSFENVCEFVIDGLPNLESVKIGDECFGIDWKGMF